MALTVGKRLQDRYRIEKAIKAGGMGAVFLAYDERLEGLCAVKEMLPSEDEWAARRFREEATTLSKLQHSGIPKVRDFFVQDKLHYLVMDYVEGHNLNDEIGRLSGTQARQDLLGALSILDYLHNLDPAIIHRDIKPSNLIRESQSGRLLLVDFGLARSLNDHTQTQAGTVMYCPPEQLVGKATFRSDLYSLAATYYVLLTGRELQMGSSKPILFHCPDLPPEMAQALDTALKLEPLQRYASAREMREALLTPLSVPPAPRRLRLWWGMVAAGMCAGGLGWWATTPNPLPVTPTPRPSTTISATPVPLPNPVLVSSPDQVYWGRVVGTGDVAEQVLAQVIAEAGAQGVTGRPVLLYDDQQRVLEVGLLLPEKAPPPKGLAKLHLPAGSFAWLVVTGGYDQLPGERERIKRWVEAQGYKPGHRFYELRRIGEANQTKSERWETDLCWEMIP